MTFINTAYAALRLVVSAIAGFIPAMLRDLGTIGTALGGGSTRPSSQTAMRAALRPAAFVVVVLLVYPALRNVYVMEFIDNPRIAHENAEKAAAEARSAEMDADAKAENVHNYVPITDSQLGCIVQKSNPLADLEAAQKGTKVVIRPLKKGEVACPD